MSTTAQEIAHELAARILPKTKLARSLLRLPSSASLNDAIDLVSADGDVSRSLVRAANLMAPSRRLSVDDVSAAIRLIGLRNTQAVVLLRQLVRATPPTLGPRNGEWFLGQALRMRDVAAWVSDRLIPQAGEDIRILALLCDYGQLAIAEAAEDVYGQVLEMADAQKRCIAPVESELLGFTHAQVGAHLFREWGFPGSHCSAIEAHHEPGLAKDAWARVLARTLNVAATLVESQEVEFADLTDLVRETAEDKDADADAETLATLTSELRTATRTSVTFRNSPVGDLIEALRSP